MVLQYIILIALKTKQGYGREFFRRYSFTDRLHSADILLALPARRIKCLLGTKFGIQISMSYRTTLKPAPK